MKAAKASKKRKKTSGKGDAAGNLAEFYSKAELLELFGAPTSVGAVDELVEKKSSSRPPRPKSQGSSSGRRTRDGRRILPQAVDPHAVIRELEPSWTEEGVSTCLFWEDHWWEYEHGSYHIIKERVIVNRLRKVTELSVFKKSSSTGIATDVPWMPNNKKIAELLGAMKFVCRAGGSDFGDKERPVNSGEWRLNPDNHPNGLIAMQNGLFDLRDKSLLPLSPRFLATYQLSFDFDESATCPRWNQFLDSVWPGDVESKNLLQEWMWYVLSGRTDLEKMMFMMGATRSGKGTVARVLSSMLGEGDVAAPTLQSLGNNFGLAPMIGRSLAIIGDARSSGGSGMQPIIARLLSITGRDQLDIDRKNQAIWTGRLPTRIMMMSNENPWFRDASGAITGRMLLLVFRESFLGKEDLSLASDLESELSGIFNWVLKGGRRMERNNWRFTTPESTLDEREELSHEISPLKEFIEECCVVGPNEAIAASDLFDAYLEFEGLSVADPHYKNRKQQTLFGFNLRRAVPRVKRVRSRSVWGHLGAKKCMKMEDRFGTPSGQPVWVYHGICLK